MFYAQWFRIIALFFYSVNKFFSVVLLYFSYSKALKLLGNILKAFFHIKHIFLCRIFLFLNIM